MSTSNGNPIPGGSITMAITDAAAAALTLVYPASASTIYSRKGTQATANTSPVVGILQDAVDAANQIREVRTAGVGLLLVNGNSVNIAAGDSIVSAAGGIGVKAATASATLQKTIGTALQPATADAVLIEVLINPQNLVKGTA